MLADLSVRPARLSDLPVILAIETACFGPDAYDRKLFAELHRKCGGLFLVAMRGARVIAYAVTCINPKEAELISIAVAPRHRSRGAASILMDSTLRRLRRRNVTRFKLMVKVSNAAAISFYRKYAFRELRRVARYYEDGSDGLLFVRFL
jgi:ribosomal-protein-alanine N-acetyltransferase